MTVSSDVKVTMALARTMRRPGRGLSIQLERLDRFVQALDTTPDILAVNPVRGLERFLAMPADAAPGSGVRSVPWADSDLIAISQRYRGTPAPADRPAVARGEDYASATQPRLPGGMAASDVRTSRARTRIDELRAIRDKLRAGVDGGRQTRHGADGTSLALTMPGQHRDGVTGSDTLSSRVALSQPAVSDIPRHGQGIPDGSQESGVQRPVRSMNLSDTADHVTGPALVSHVSTLPVDGLAARDLRRGSGAGRMFDDRGFRPVPGVDQPAIPAGARSTEPSRRMSVSADRAAYPKPTLAGPERRPSLVSGSSGRPADAQAPDHRLDDDARALDEASWRAGIDQP